MQPFSIGTNGVVFLSTERTENYTTGYACVPFVFVHNNDVEVLMPEPRHGVAIRDRMRRLEVNPKRVAALARARQRLGTWLSNEPEAPASSRLAALRLRAGLSQAQLAEALGTSQPTVARMEKGEGNHTMSKIRTWAKALNVTPNDLFEAFDATNADAAAKEAKP